MTNKIKKKKILMINSGNLSIGGVEKIIMGISSKLQNITFDILSFKDGSGYYDKEFLSFGGKIHKILSYDGTNKLRKAIEYYVRPLRVLKKTYKLMKNEGPYDAIHCNHNHETAIIVIAAYFAKIKIRIAHSHSAMNRFKNMGVIRYIYNKFLLSITNKFSTIKIGCSFEAFISFFGEKYLSYPGSYIIPGFVDLSLFNIEHKKRDKREKLLVNIARYTRGKNQIFLIELMPYILKLIPDATLLLVGYDSRYEEQNMMIKKRINELGLSKKIKLLPSNSDIPEILSKADMFLLPSLIEGVSIVLMEAQSMEVPCLVSDTVSQEADCGLCKFLSLDESKEKWAEELLILISDTTRKLNKEKLLSFDINNYTTRIADLY